ncbi:MAG TPA: hypothetical protein VFJ84_00035 [Candidatus Saccharimonadales bacterium]|nr:hypothetical protein [Candidatus Saccharimonadales bacterium]
MPDENRVFDVTRPKNVSPSATSKPVIVGHQPVVSDPMVREEKPAPTRISINESAADGPGSEILPETAAPAIIEPTVSTVPETPEAFTPDNRSSRPMPQYDPIVPANIPDDQDSSIPRLPKLEPEAHETGRHIEGLHLAPARKKKRWPRYLSLVILLLIAVYLVLDSGLINTGIKLPFHVFKQKSQPAASSAASSQAPSQAANTPAGPSIPDGFKEYRIAGTNITFAAPLAWGDPTSLTDPGYTKRGGAEQTDGTFAYLVNFATNKNLQIAVTSNKYLPAKRTPLYYDYLQWCTGTSDGKFYLSTLNFSTENRIDTPTTITCDQGPITSTQKLDDTTIVQSKATDSAKKVIGDIYIKNLTDPSLVVFRVKDASMTNGDNIKQLLNTVQVSSASQ